MVDFHLFLERLSLLYNKYIGLKYKNLGRDFDGVDCYGLLYLFYKNELNIELPDFYDLGYEKEWYKNCENHILNNIGTKWIKVDKPYKVFDGLVFFLGTKKVANHIALYIGKNKILHIYENITSRIDVLDYNFENNLYGIMRYHTFL